jgi:DNA-directed RNA polymerase subunit H (RpoH/RPB5)
MTQKNILKIERRQKIIHPPAAKIMEDDIQPILLPYRIYLNLAPLFASRKLELVSGDATKLSGAAASDYLGENKFTEVIQRNNYIMVEARDIRGRERRHPKKMHPTTRSMPTRTIMILLNKTDNKNDDHGASSAKFKKLIDKIPGINSSARDQNIDIIVISYAALGSNIITKCAEIESPGSDESGYIRITRCQYYYFTSNRLAHCDVPPCRILSPAEAKEVLANLMLERINLQKIRAIDVEAVWLGAEVGDIIKFSHFSENSGWSLAYRAVKS